MKVTLKQNYSFIGVLVLLFLMSCDKKEKVEVAPVRPVKYQKVDYLGGDKLRSFSGTAKTEKVVNLSFRNTGIITELNMKLGQQVKKGDLLGRLDNVSSRLNYESSI